MVIQLYCLLLIAPLFDANYTITVIIQSKQMAKHLVQLIIAGAQVVGRAFTQAVRQEIRMSQEAAKKSASRQSKFECDIGA